MNAPPGADRLHALDAVRAGALLLGIVLHGALSFVPLLPDVLWPVHDVSQHWAMAVLAFVIHVFRMSVFFLIAGLLAHALFHRLGPRAFWRNRARRIALPLVLAWPVSFALLAAVALWVLAKNHGGTLPPIPEETIDAGLNFLHLWFLYILLWLYAIVLALHGMLRAIDARQSVAQALDRTLRALLATPLRSLVLAGPIALALGLQPLWDWRGGVPTPAYTWLPPAAPLFVFAYLFGIGWLLDRQRTLLASLQRGWAVRLAIGVVCSAVCLVLAASEFGLRVEHERAWRFGYALGYASALIGWTLGLIGAGLRFLSEPSRPLRYLADASYWMYIAHLPLVMALQTAWMQLGAPWWLKYAAVVLASAALLLWSYKLWVRRTWLGALLNGSRRPA
jgi:peptidoglycan/LPS O-acetylase OafA/YrhL